MSEYECVRACGRVCVRERVQQHLSHPKSMLFISFLVQMEKLRLGGREGIRLNKLGGPGWDQNSDLLGQRFQFD